MTSVQESGRLQDKFFYNWIKLDALYCNTNVY
jgi:hypothetical protein